jgi:hypothetical protein
MAHHRVSFQLPERKLGKSNIEFIVTVDGTKLGELWVSRGAVVWKPQRSKRTLRVVGIRPADG